MSHKQPSCWGDAAKHANRSQFKAPGVYCGALGTDQSPSCLTAAVNPLILRGDLYACVKRQRCVCGWSRRRGRRTRRRRMGHRWCWCESVRWLINVAGLAAKRWSAAALFFDSAALVMDSDGEAATDVFFEARPTEGFDERPTVSCRHSTGLSCYWHRHRWIAAGINRAENQT